MLTSPPEAPAPKAATASKLPNALTDLEATDDEYFLVTGYHRPTENDEPEPEPEPATTG
ncbi:MAG: hypothetical protein ABID63_08145 [Pseudomonadota bacterium]